MTIRWRHFSMHFLSAPNVPDVVDPKIDQTQFDEISD